MTEQTQLATRDLPSRTHLGDREQIAAIHKRMASMMQLPQDVPADVIWAAAQLAVAHKLNPFVGEIYILPLKGGKYAPYIGVKGLRTLARRQANFMTEFDVLEPAEVETYRQGNYHEGEVGVRCTLYRLDVARECKELDIPYKPTYGVGIWRQGDQLPNTWTPHHVAEKRAEVNAIKQAFDLAVDVGDPAQDVGEVVSGMDYYIEQEEREHALPQHNEAELDEDGLFVQTGQPELVKEGE